MYDAPPRSLYRETPEDKEAREHYEFGMMYGAQPPAPFYGTEPYHRYDYDVHYDPYSMQQFGDREYHSRFTPDDEKYRMDMTMSDREIATYRTREHHQQRKQSPK